MTATTNRAPAIARPLGNTLTAGKLPKYAPLSILGDSLIVSGLIFLLVQQSTTDKSYNVTGAVVVGALLYAVTTYTASLLIEGRRKAKDRLLTTLVAAGCTAPRSMVRELWHLSAPPQLACDHAAARRPLH